jgi:trimeric autotransporter adhesin
MTALLKTTNIQEPSSSTVNLALSTSGGVTVGQNLTVTGTTTLSGSTTLPSSTSLTTPTLVTPNITTGLTLTGAAGTSGQVLTSAGSGSAPTWSTPSAGAMTLISTKTASASSSLSWTGLSGYNNYLLILNNISATAANDYLIGEIGEGAGPTYLTSGYSISIFGQQGSSSVTGINSRSGGSDFIGFQNFSAYSSNSGGGISGSIFLNGMLSGTKFFASGLLTLNGQGAGSTYTNNINNGYFGDTTAKTAILISFIYNTIASGSASLYGISS